MQDASAVVYPSKQCVLLSAKHWNKVHALIPTAKQLQHKGRSLIAVPHKREETLVLNNIGFDVPHPAELYYAWPGRYKPMQSQKDTVKFLSTHPRAFVLSEIGTGKTLAALWAFDYLRSTKSANKALIVAPLSTIDRVWADEVFEHFRDLECVVLHGSREKRIKLLQQPADIYVINPEGIHCILDALDSRTDIDTIIIDELAIFRNAQTNLWKCAAKLVAKRERVWGLTGAPIPNAPTDAYAQVKLVRPKHAPRYFAAFRDEVMRKVSTFKWVARDGALERVYSVMQPSIRFTRDECLDLPPLTTETREVALTVAQHAVYEKMRKTLMVEYAGGQINAANEAVKAMKLVQIACGQVRDNDGEEVRIPAETRMEAVKEIIEQSPAKVIVFVPFIFALQAVAEFLSKHFTVAVVYGSVSKKDRGKIFSAFQDDADPRVLVAQPDAMAHGLTLTAASVVIWYAPITSAETYQQACGRISRAGQQLAQLVVHIEGTALERAMFNRLKNKETMQGILLDMVKRDRA